jgi:S-layer family protein
MQAVRIFYTLQVSPAPAVATFSDVPPSHPFFQFIEALAASGITAGCGGGNYCRNNAVTRAQMAVFILKAKHGQFYLPPDCTQVFDDVPCPSQFADWIEQLFVEGIAVGCGGNNYCPNNAVTRAQMSAFLLKGKFGSSHVPPPCQPDFNDVACPGNLFADWISELVDLNITAGCGGGNYCPTLPNTRGQMAVFLYKTFLAP